jgi:hypothetical protein
MKFDEPRHAVEIAVALEPDLLEGLLAPFPDAEAVMAMNIGVLLFEAS